MQSGDPTDQTTQSKGKELSEKELHDARKLVQFLLLAWRNYGLYPEGHAASTKALATLE